MTAQPVLIDCDPGIDDALALILALAAPDEIDVLQVTTVAGNKPLAKTTANARRVLDLMGRGDVPVSAGCAAPLDGPVRPEGDFHGRDGLGDTGLPEPSAGPDGRHAVDVLAETVMARPAGSLTLCALGPLTNVARAIEREPRLAARLGRLLVMGGGLHNGPPEFNFRCDPRAAQQVLSSGARIELFGLDACRQAPLADPLRTRVGGLAGRLLEALGAKDQCLYDVYVVARLLAPALFERREMAIAVEWRDSATAGVCAVSRDPAAPRIEAVTGIDVLGLLELLAARYPEAPGGAVP